MIPLRIGRLTLRLHLGLGVIALVLFSLGGDLWVRYLLLLGILFLHEIAHALTSLAFAGKRAVVSFWPWGGVAHVERFSDYREAIVALAGPLANLALAGVLAVADAQLTLMLVRCALIDFALTCTLLMGIANLLPIPGLDGGCVLACFARRRRR